MCNIPDSILPAYDIDTSVAAMANPFAAEPHALCRWAAEQVMHDAAARKEWQAEIGKGKMMGVLIVRYDEGKSRRIGYLRAYSGQICGRRDWLGYVPAVFDYLQPDGYFKLHEAEIDNISDEIEAIVSSDDYLCARKELAEMTERHDRELAEMRRLMAASKRRRDEQRLSDTADDNVRDRLVRESQHEKAEMRRRKRAMTTEMEAVRKRIEQQDAVISELKNRRHRLSDSLQRWLFSQFILQNADGESRSVLDIFSYYNSQLPPAGTGECCAPKLINYAFVNNMKPLALAEFWFGESPRGELRRHGGFYEPCKSKCRPLLAWMLNEDYGYSACNVNGKSLQPAVVYEDEHIVVVDKPSGMMSVEGRTDDVSLEQWLRKRYKGETETMMVHRLDMDTSGLIVAAKTKEAHRILQQQFEHRTVKKRYTAVVCGMLSLQKGIIDIPIGADYDNRPMQMVDEKHGKRAVTRYEAVGNDGRYTRLHLFPETGRTHQLRVHCAYFGGLNAPIRGDRLYGNAADRL